ncbi:MAG TPA: acetate uptake transporter [Actinomycetota bacterium]|jgi:succinate-acetate transporter protein|nr:acetate uptake transporter [Actinomycetota bacterium]
MTDERPRAAIAEPGPLGLGAFALTTFVLSAHNAGWAPDVMWVGLALFYGGLGQFMAGMWEFRTGNTFGATAFSTYGAFWLSLGTFAVLRLLDRVPLEATQVLEGLGWFLLAFAIFNTYMLLWSTRVSVAVFLVFLSLEITEILLASGFFLGDAAGEGLVMAGGYAGIVTAAIAWYASAAGVVNSMAGRPLLVVGRPLWREPEAAAPVAPAPSPARAA